MHALMACGALKSAPGASAPEWVAPKRSERFLFPVHALSRVLLERLTQARRLLAMPAANPQAQEHARTFMKRVAGIEINTCPHCHGRWRAVEQRGADPQALRGLLPSRAASCRGPP